MSDSKMYERLCTQTIRKQNQTFQDKGQRRVIGVHLPKPEDKHITPLPLIALYSKEIHKINDTTNWHFNTFPQISVRIITVVEAGQVMQRVLQTLLLNITQPQPLSRFRRVFC